MSKPFTIDWDITYERSGSQVSWRATGWDSNDNDHILSSGSRPPYWFDSKAEAHNNALDILAQYTDNKRFKHDNVESVTL